MRTTIFDIQKMKERGEQIPMITAYDYISAQLVDNTDIPILLVGDSLGVFMLGHSTVEQVTLQEMIHHMKAVARGNKHSLIIADMPFFTYTSIEEAIQTAKLFLQEGGVQAVKLEGGVAIVPIIRRLVELGVAVMAHIGITPQLVNQVRGKSLQEQPGDTAKQLIEEAGMLESAGAFAIVLESIPAHLAQNISSHLKIPTIGTGSGSYCDGQTQIWHNILGVSSGAQSSYANLSDIIIKALQCYATDVRERAFQSPQVSNLATGAT